MFQRVVLTFLAVLIGCTSNNYKDIPRHDGEMPPYALTVGEVVSVTTNSENILEFEITEISKYSIRGNDIEVGYDNIRAVRVKKAAETEKGSNFLYILMAIELVLVVAFTAVFG
jgi:hypothetical protein